MNRRFPPAIVLLSQSTRWTIMQPDVIRPDERDEYYFREGCYILEVSNSPLDPDLSIARARLAPGQRTRRHRLEGVTERYLIVQGEGRVSVGEGVARQVRAGDVVLIPPGVTQSIENIGNHDLVFHALCTPRFTPDCYRDVEDSCLDG